MTDLNRMVRAGDLLLASDVRRLCGIAPGSRHTLLNWRARHGFPEPVRAIKVGKGRKAQRVEIWARPDVKAWLAAHPIQTREIVPDAE